MAKISVIIPIYNVEHYIERCAVSLLGQTFKDLEYIFVNDYTRDNSMEVLHSVLEEYPERKGQVRIINHEKNEGLASARYSGIQQASGEYIIHCDSDDWVELDMYEKMYNIAHSEDADIVVCDLIHEYKDAKKIEELNQYLCNKLVKRNLIFENDIFPIAGLNMWEDVLQSNKLFYHAKNVCYVDEPLYHYNRTNENSIVSATSLLEKRKQQCRVIEHLNNYFNQRGFDFSDAYFAYRVAMKDKFLELTPTDYKSWRGIYPEIANYVLMDKNNSFIYRVCYYLAQKGLVLPFDVLRKLSRSLHA